VTREQEIRDLERQLGLGREKFTQLKGPSRIDRIKVREPVGGAPYVIWVWGQFQYPVGRIAGLCLQVWERNGTVRVVDDMGQVPFPNLFQLIWDMIEPEWASLKERAAEAPENPTTGYKRTAAVAVELEHEP
jgi:hypothetical protein